MDEKTLTYKIENKHINKKILKKMTLIYNALDDGWSVKKKTSDVYIFNKSHLYSEGIIGDEMVPYEMSSKSSVNIDSELDLLLFECLLDAK